MAFLRKLLGLGTLATSRPERSVQFPEEDLLATAARGYGYFLAEPGLLLKDGRYQIIRKLGRGRCSNTFLVKDLSPQLAGKTGPQTYLAAKILNAAFTEGLRQGQIQELRVLEAVLARPGKQPPLPILYDHFAQRGPHGVHYCFLTSPQCTDIHRFRASAPTGRLGVHFVKPIIAGVLEGLIALHELNIMHSDIKADNVLLYGPSQERIEPILAKEPVRIDGSFQFEGESYPIFRSQPFLPPMSWDDSPCKAELTGVILSDLGSATWVDTPSTPGDIGAFALRAPENVIRAQSGKEIDIWAIGCMTYELLMGEILFKPEPTTDLTADESLVLLQYALTGETFTPEIVQQSHAKDQYFDAEGTFLKAKSHAYPQTTVQELLSRNNDLTPNQVISASSFISACLRLNPADRPTAKQLDRHLWLITAFMGGEEVDPEDIDDDLIPPYPFTGPKLIDIP